MDVKRSWWVAFVLAGSLSGGWARADEPAPVSVTEGAEIQLKNGELRRGTLVSVEPGQRVILIVAGQESVIPWGEVARIVGGPGQQPPPAPAAEQAPEMGKPFVHIESDWPDAELSRVDAETSSGMYGMQGPLGEPSLNRFICRAPCDKLVDGREGHRFFIMAPGMYPSPQFRLDGYAGPVTARVTGTSASQFLGGVIGVGLGTVLTLGGGMFFGMSYLIAGQAPSEETPDPQREARDVRAAGIGFGAVGLASLATGIVFLSGGTTRVEIIEEKPGRSGLSFDAGIFRF